MTQPVEILRRPAAHRRRRRRVAAAVAVVILGVVVAANQPSGTSTSTGGAPPPDRSAVRAATTPRSVAPQLRVLREPVTFHDRTTAQGPGPPIAAASGILVDLDRRTILWERQAHEPRPPASTTKLLATLVALENFDPDREVTITADALNQAGDETTMGLKAGMRMRVSELLAGMLLVSGNDAATALAVDTTGLDAFVAAMNRQVDALGLEDSHFTSPVGLDDPEMRTSAYDLAAIAAALVDHFPSVLDLTSRLEMTLPASADHPAFDLVNLDRLLRLYPGTVGLKPGYTGDAGPCLVAMAVRDGHRLVAILLDDPELYTDARALLDWGFVREGLRLVSLGAGPRRGLEPLPAG